MPRSRKREERMRENHILVLSSSAALGETAHKGEKSEHQYIHGDWKTPLSVNSG